MPKTSVFLRFSCTLAFVAVLACPTAALAQDAYRWQELEGTWRGEGVLRVAPGDVLEQGACRFTVEAGTEQSLSITGRCANAMQTGQISTELTRDVSGSITAIAMSPLVSEPVVLNGRQTGRTIRLSSGDAIMIGETAYVISSQIEGWSGDGAFTLVQQLTTAGEEPVIVLQMRFARTD